MLLSEIQLQLASNAKQDALALQKGMCCPLSASKQYRPVACTQYAPVKGLFPHCHDATFRMLHTAVPLLFLPIADLPSKL